MVNVAWPNTTLEAAAELESEQLGQPAVDSETEEISIVTLVLLPVRVPTTSAALRQPLRHPLLQLASSESVLAT